MKNESENNSTEVRVVDLINFHGLTLWVAEHEGTKYIQLKPLADLAGIDWRGAKKVVFNDDNVILYGTKRLDTPIFVASVGDITPQKPAVYIRLDRSRMYLARIDTSRMRSHGKTEAATNLLNLQIEWAQALDQYENNGVAYKTNKSHLKDLCGMLKIVSKNRQESINQLIDIELAILGVPVKQNNDTQRELEV